jgi:hypothetical protein
MKSKKISEKKAISIMGVCETLYTVSIQSVRLRSYFKAKIL